jgi:hypothetical protein
VLDIVGHFVHSALMTFARTLGAARFDPEHGAPLLMRLVVNSKTKLSGLPQQTVRVNVDRHRDLALAPSTASTACIAYSLPNGKSGTVIVQKTITDEVTGATAFAAAPTGCLP